MINKILSALFSGIVIFLLWLSVSSFQSFVLGICDVKFGCKGTVQFSMLISGIAGMTTSISFLAASVINDTGEIEIKKKHLFLTGIIGDAILSVLLLTVPNWGVEIVGMVLGWLLLSFILFTGIFALVKRFFTHVSNKALNMFTFSG